MSTATALATLGAGLVVILGALGALVRTIWRATTQAAHIVTAVRELTAADTLIAERLADVADRLSDHEVRIVHLEQLRPGGWRPDAIDHP